MKPAFSVISFTTVAGAGQGLAVALAFATLSGVPLGPTFLPLCLAVALVLCCGGGKMVLRLLGLLGLVLQRVGLDFLDRRF